MRTLSLSEYLTEARALLTSAPSTEIAKAASTLEQVYREGKRLFVCGNGGSASNASHFAEDISKLLFNPERGGRLPATALTDSTPLMTALANDFGYETIFATQLAMHAVPGDGLVCISCSGNSPNVVGAMRWAAAHDMRTLALTGGDGGQLRGLAEICIHVASPNVGMVEGIHTLLLDYLGKEMRHRAYGTPHEAV